jgi:hypothetical protein
MAGVCTSAFTRRSFLVPISAARMFETARGTWRKQQTDLDEGADPFI